MKTTMPAIVLAATIGLALSIGGAVAAPKPRPIRGALEQPFLVNMMVGDPDEVIVRNGPLQLIARCFLADNTRAALQLAFTSSLDDWATTSTLSSGARLDLPAGEQPFAQVSNANPEFASGAGGLSFIAVAPDGSYLAVGRDTFAAGVNVFGADCFAVGVLTQFKGRLKR